MKLAQRIKTAFKFLLGGISFGRFATITSSGKIMRRQSAETDPYGNFAGWVYLAIDKTGEAVDRIDKK